MPARSRLYIVEAFGITNPWVVWGIARGLLDEFCAACQSRGFVVTSPCHLREADPDVGAWCSVADGCDECRRVCPACRGARLTRGDVVRAEDFGDEDSLRAAQQMSPGIVVDPRKRSDREARAM